MIVHFLSVAINLNPGAEQVGWGHNEFTPPPPPLPAHVASFIFGDGSLIKCTCGSDELSFSRRGAAIRLNYHFCAGVFLLVSAKMVDGERGSGLAQQTAARGANLSAAPSAAPHAGASMEISSGRSIIEQHENLTGFFFFFVHFQGDPITYVLFEFMLSNSHSPKIDSASYLCHS